MTEKYCPVCQLVHTQAMELCCNCDGELVERESTDNGKDKSYPFCIDQIEIA